MEFEGCLLNHCETSVKYSEKIHCLLKTDKPCLLKTHKQTHKVVLRLDELLQQPAQIQRRRLRR
jgi:hypothetical protein